MRFADNRFYLFGCLDYLFQTAEKMEIMMPFILWTNSEHPAEDWKCLLTGTLPQYLYGLALFNPSWQHIQSTLARMDGNAINEVVLIHPNTSSLMVGGGNNGNYMVVYFSSSSSSTLVNPSTKEEQKTTRMNIQTPDEYPMRFAVPLSMVLTVFRYFFDTGYLPNDMIWEQE